MVGHGRWTKIKQQHFSEILGVEFACTGAAIKSANARWPGWAGPGFCYVDLTAGPGETDGLAGSPLRFVEVAISSGRSWRAWLFEETVEHAEMLRWRLGELGQDVVQHAEVFAMNHNEGMDHVIAAVAGLRGKQYGLIYDDPNGTVIDIAALQRLANDAAFSHVDILCNIAAASYKRFRKAFVEDDRPFLLDHLEAVGKKHIYLREPVGQHQWTLALLTNWERFPEMRKIGLYNRKSAEGARILDTLNLTTREREESAESRKGQMTLW